MTGNIEVRTLTSGNDGTQHIKTKFIVKNEKKKNFWKKQAERNDSIKIKVISKVIK